MVKHLLCAVLLLSVPALATITNYQSKATWNSTSGSCNVNLNSKAIQSGDLIVLWVTWSPSTLTVPLPYVDPNGDTFVNAVGPTVQSTSNTAAQIVYAKNVNANSAGVNLTITFSGTATTASCDSC
jgi:hypothetical protein